MTPSPATLVTLERSIRAVRRMNAARSPWHFAKVYLPHHLNHDFGRMHLEVLDLLTGTTKSRGGRIAIAAPRGHAKSTLVSLAYVLWCLLYGHERFVVLISATKELAASHLASVRRELEENVLLQEDFPALAPAIRRRRRGKWRASDIELPLMDPRTGQAVSVLDRQSRSRATSPARSPATSPARSPATSPDREPVEVASVNLRAYGAGQRIRGVRNGPVRPSLIIVDDLESQEHVQHEDNRRKLRDWFDRTLLKLGQPDTNVIVVGTVLHRDSLLANLVGVGSSDARPAPGWTARVYKAIKSWSIRPELWKQWQSVYSGLELKDPSEGPARAEAFFQANREAMLEGTRVLWPTRESYEQLMIERFREGESAFAAEKLNEPIDPQLCLFAKCDLRYWDDTYPDVAALLGSQPGPWRLYGACDPSLGKADGDDSAVVCVLEHPRTRMLYVTAAEIGKRNPSELVALILNVMPGYNFQDFGVEVNQFQELLATQLEQAAERQRPNLPIKRIQSRGDKVARIKGLEPLVASGRIQFSRRHTKLVEQLRSFPTARHDDGPDALEMAVSLTLGYSGPMTVRGVV